MAMELVLICIMVQIKFNTEKMYSFVTKIILVWDNDGELRIRLAPKIVSAINKVYALNYNAGDTSRRATIYTHTISGTDTALTLEEKNSSENIYRIKLNSKGYYLTAASASNSARVIWETENNENN